MDDINHARGAWRIVAVAGHLLWGAAIALSCTASCTWRMGPAWYTTPRGRARIQHWTVRFNKLIGLRVTVHGQPAPSPCLIAANHISWLDIPAIMAVTPAVFTAKSDVRDWPFIGTFSALAGTLFIARGNLSGLRTVIGEAAAQLRNGQTIAIFPEGTTTTGETVGEFRAALFQSAITEHRPVQPVAIRYVDHTGERRAAFVGDDTFIRHLYHTLCHRHTDVAVHYLEPLVATNEGKNLAAQAHHYIAQCLRQPDDGAHTSAYKSGLLMNVS